MTLLVEQQKKKKEKGCSHWVQTKCYKWIHTLQDRHRGGVTDKGMGVILGICTPVL